MSKVTHNDQLFNSFSFPNSSPKEIKLPEEISEQKFVAETFRILERAVEQSVDGIAVANINGIIRFCNQAWADMHGYCVSEVIGKNLSIFHTEEQLANEVIPFNELVKKRGYHKGEVGHVRKNGNVFETWMMTTMLKDEKGIPLGIIGTARDITGQKKLQEALTRSEQQYRNTIDSMADAIHVVDKDLRFVVFNPVFSNWNKQLGLETDAIGKSLFEVFPFLPDKVREEYETVFMTGKNLQTEEVTEFTDKEIITETRKIPIFEGDKVIQVVTVIRDITQRKKTEQDLRFLSEISRNMSEGVSLVSLSDGSILYTNSKFDEMFGYGRGELVGKHVSILNASSEKSSQDLVKEIFEALDSNGVWKGEICNTKKDGTNFWGFASVSVFEHPKYGKVAVSVHTDITDRKVKRQELEASEQKYRFLFERSPVFAIVIDKDLKLRDINESSLETLGYREYEVIGRDVFDFLVPEDKKKVAETLNKAIAGEEPPGIEVNVYAKDKTIHAILFSQGRQFIFSESGETEGILFTGIDITERKRAERQQSSVTTGLRAVLEAADKLIACPDIDTVFKRAVEFARERFGLERCAIFVEENGAVRGIYGTDRYGRTTDERSLKFEKNEVWKRRLKMLDTRDPNWVVVREPQLEWDGKSSVQIGEGWIVVTPIQSAHRPIGVFVNDSAISGSSLDPMKQDTLAVFCSLIGSIIERKRAEQRLEVVNKRLLQTSRRFKQLSLRDSHTGLFNHRYLIEMIEAEFNRAKRYGFSLSYIMLDLDYFKSVNDVYGHQFGDLILKQFARHLKKIVRQYDILVRFGGEEFVIISPGIDRETALVLSQRILNSVYLKSFGNDEHNVKLKLSIAVSSFPEDNVSCGMDLVNIADKILNKAKEDGGGRVYCMEDTKKHQTDASEVTNGHNNIQFLQEKLEKLTKRANQSLIESIFAFAKTIKLKDNYTGEHVENTVYFASEIAKKLGLPESKIEQVRQAAQLHDLGKIGISDKILLKKTKLSKFEFEEIKKHPMIAADILRPIQFLQEIIPSILYHHERWDGKGYPFGLKGEDIPVGARIVAISDVYHALISDRPYRPAFSKAQAIKLIKAGSGTQFDSKIVEVFLSLP